MADSPTGIFIERLRAAVKSGETTPAKIAQASGLGLQTVLNYLKKGSEPGLDKAQAIARGAFGVSLSQFLGDDSEPTLEYCYRRVGSAVRNAEDESLRRRLLAVTDAEWDRIEADLLKSRAAKNPKD